MDNFDRLNELILYIENNLTAHISSQKLAQILCVNEYTMYRIFNFITGMSVTDYIRKRRLSMAGIELQNSNIKIMDLAIKYNYESSQSFSRAFYKFHGVHPSKVKNSAIYLKTFPPYNFSNITINKELKYRIETHDELKLYGIYKECTINDIKNIAPKFWIDIQKNSEYNNLFLNFPQYGVIEYDNLFPNPVNSKYYIAFNKSFENSTEIIIPKSTWAIFEIVETTGEYVCNFFRKVYKDWIPYSGYNIRNCPELELYYQTHAEWWLPIEF